MRGIPKGDIITQSFVVKQPSELLDFLISNQIRKSKNAIQSVLKRKLITVNGKLVTQHDFPVKAGDKVAVMKVDQTKKIKRLQGMSIVYEDDIIIVIDKEAGLLSVATDKERDRTAYAVLTNYVQKKSRLAKIFLLHRLDRESSGLMIFAKDLDTQGKFQRNWNFQVPLYLFSIVVEGAMPNKEGEIKSWLTENKNYHVFSSSFDNGGKEAISQYRTIKSNDNYSLVEFEQVTRQRNQLRAQLEQIKRPIVGDKKYGATSNPIKRVAMHVNKMNVKHPLTGKMLTFESPIPYSLKSLLKSTENIKTNE